MSQTAKESLHCIFFSTRDLSSPPRDGTSTPCSGSVESYPLDHQGSPDSDNFDRSVIFAKTLYPPLITLCLSLGLFNIPRFFFWILTNMCALGRYPRTCLSLSSVSMTVSGSTCVAAHGSILSLYGWAMSHCLSHAFCSQSSALGHLGCFRVLAVVSSGAVSTGVRVPLWTIVFSRCAQEWDGWITRQFCF